MVQSNFFYGLYPVGSNLREMFPLWLMRLIIRALLPDAELLATLCETFYHLSSRAVGVGGSIGGEGGT